MYQLTQYGVKKDTDENIPNNQINRDWRKYQEWLKEGNTPEPMDIITPSVDPRIAMIDNVKTIDDVKAILKDLFGLNKNVGTV